MRAINIGFMTLCIVACSSQIVNAQTAKPNVKINHTAIFVQNLAATKFFYEKIVGLDTIPEPFHDGKHAWFKLGAGISMHVIQGSTEKKEYYKNQHTCFSVASVHDFADKLKLHSIPYEDVSGNKNAISRRVDGVRQIWLQDPDGYWIEINDAKE